LGEMMVEQQNLWSGKRPRWKIGKEK